MVPRAAVDVVYDFDGFDVLRSFEGYSPPRVSLLEKTHANAQMFSSGRNWLLVTKLTIFIPPSSLNHLVIRPYLLISNSQFESLN